MLLLSGEITFVSIFKVQRSCGSPCGFTVYGPTHFANCKIRMFPWWKNFTIKNSWSFLFSHGASVFSLLKNITPLEESGRA